MLLTWLLLSAQAAEALLAVLIGHRDVLVRAALMIHGLCRPVSTASKKCAIDSKQLPQQHVLDTLDINAKTLIPGTSSVHEKMRFFPCKGCFVKRRLR